MFRLKPEAAAKYSSARRIFIEWNASLFTLGLTLLLLGVVVCLQSEPSGYRSILRVVFGLLALFGLLVVCFSYYVHVEFRIKEHRRMVDWLEGFQRHTNQGFDAIIPALNELRARTAKPIVVEEYEVRDDEEERPLSSKERNSLLAIIALLCEETGLDLRRHAAAAAVLKNKADNLGVSIGESTIEQHLRRAREALQSKRR